MKEASTLLAQDIERRNFRIQYDQCVRIVLSNKPIYYDCTDKSGGGKNV